jgi:DnaJ family protein B protein 12
MEGNRDEALKCLAIAQRHRDSGNYSSARKFCDKSIALYSTPEALKLLAIIEEEAAASPSSSSDKGKASSSATETHPSASGTRHRTGTANGGGAGVGQDQQKREYTVEQITIVKKVRGSKANEYYEILGLTKECEEAEIKKAYRKVCGECRVPSRSLSLTAERIFIHDSWRYNYILIRMELREQTKLLKVIIAS